MKTLKLIFLISIIPLLASCSDSSDNKASGDHVWKEQTDTIDKAKEVEAAIQKSFDLQKEAIEEQGQ